MQLALGFNNSATYFPPYYFPNIVRVAFHAVVALLKESLLHLVR